MRNLAALYSIVAIGLVVSAQADLTIVQRVEGVGQDGEVTVKIKGDKERIDAPSQPTRIIDGKTGEMTDLLSDKKSFVRISAEQIKAAAETINKFDSGEKRSEEHTSELQSQSNLVCRLLLEKKKTNHSCDT